MADRVWDLRVSEHPCANGEMYEWRLVAVPRWSPYGAQTLSNRFTTERDPAAVMPDLLRRGFPRKDDR